MLLPGVQYLTGQCFDLAPLIACGARAPARAWASISRTRWATCPLRLHDWNADFAVWCSYKYLNAGPGAIGGCFVHERHARRGDLPRFAGWWGHDAATRFEMGPDFAPIAGAEGWQISNPPILSTAPLLASLELFQRAGIDRLREKSIALTACHAAPDRASGWRSKVEIITPRRGHERGCQLSLRSSCRPPRPGAATSA